MCSLLLLTYWMISEARSVHSIHVRSRLMEHFRGLPGRFKSETMARISIQNTPSADVAVMFVELPSNANLKGIVTPNWFADDSILTDLEVHPGDELYSLGFPLNFEANSLGFPVLRSGKLASSPIVPLKTSDILFDFRVFGGNSGGPVYFAFINRFYKESTQFGVNQKILGLVSQQALSTFTGHPEPLSIAKICS
jgi:hypothetical protein